MCLCVNKIVASLVSGLTSRLKRLKRRNEPGQPWVTAWVTSRILHSWHGISLPKPVRWVCCRHKRERRSRRRWLFWAQLDIAVPEFTCRDSKCGSLTITGGGLGRSLRLFECAVVHMEFMHAGSWMVCGRAMHRELHRSQPVDGWRFRYC